MTTAEIAWRIIDLLNWGTDYFSEKGIENARREIEWLLCNVLCCKRIDLYLKFENILTHNELKRVRSMIMRRIAGEPFQHIIGKAPFYGRDFVINRNVLIPRTETGVLIDRLKENGKVPSLLDVGTGSGCIAITCAMENLSEKIYATDISSEALDVARENMQLYKTKHIQVDLHNFLTQDFNTRFNVVISNPPYIRVDEMDSLQKEVRNYDPKIALTDGSDGYVFYRLFAKRFNDLICRSGYMLLEIGGNTHKKGVEKIFSDFGLRTTYYKDLQGDYRAVEVKK